MKEFLRFGLLTVVLVCVLTVLSNVGLLPKVAAIAESTVVLLSIAMLAFALYDIIRRQG